LSLLQEIADGRAVVMTAENDLLSNVRSRLQDPDDVRARPSFEQRIEKPAEKSEFFDKEDRGQGEDGGGDRNSRPAEEKKNRRQEIGRGQDRVHPKKRARMLDELLDPGVVAGSCQSVPEVPRGAETARAAGYPGMASFYQETSAREDVQDMLGG
jgi:hypothetical protein